MTLKVKQNGVFTAVGGSGGTAGAWTRPGDWLALPTVNEGEQKVVGLVAVYEGDSNFVGVQCQGAYTVDWGDGSAPVNYASNALAIKNILWSSVASGTLTSGGLRQAVVTITPQAGSNLTSVVLNPTLTSVGVGSTAATMWLDVAVAGANVSMLTVGTTRPARLLQQFTYVGPSNITTVVPGLANCSRLRNVVGTQWTATQTSFASMFSGCASLTTLPLLNTGAGTNFTSMFTNCTSLLEVPLLNTSAGTNFTSMFQGCTSLQTVPLLTTAAGTNFTAMFSGCASLTSAPHLTTTAGLNFSSMFQSCVSLTRIPLLDTAAGTDLSFMFNGCSALQFIPLISAASSTSNGSTFTGCTSLQVGAMAGTKTTISYASCKLSATQLDAIYSNLASGVTGQTITVTGNHGVAGDSPAIATAKGWTVTG